MGLRRELIAAVIRVLAVELDLVRKPDQFQLFMNHMWGYESYDQHLARVIDEELDRVSGTVKRMKTDREFQKIVENM